jgi:hypothetical protein
MSFVVPYSLISPQNLGDQILHTYNVHEVEMGEWIGLVWLRIETGDGIFECDNESSGSIIWRGVSSLAAGMTLFDGVR